MGIHSSLSIPAGLLLFWPSVEITREASHTASQTGATSTRIEGSGWTTNGAVAITLPVRRGLDLTPSAGYVFGSVGANFTSTTASGFGLPTVSTDAFSDRIRGWWASLELSVQWARSCC